eukprot:1154489-Pelagomonas_calceolata.AAC.3
MVQWTHLLVGNASVGQSIAESSKTSTDRSGKFGLARLLCHAGNRLNHSMLCWRQLIGAHFRAGTSSELMESPGHVKGVPASQGCYPCPAERSPFFPSSKYVLVISRAKECVKQNEWSISGCLWWMKPHIRQNSSTKHQWNATVSRQHACNPLAPGGAANTACNMLRVGTQATAAGPPSKSLQRHHYPFIPASVWILYFRGVALSTSATKRARQRMPFPHISGSLPSELKMRMVRSVSPMAGRAKMTWWAQGGDLTVKTSLVNWHSMLACMHLETSCAPRLLPRQSCGNTAAQPALGGGGDECKNVDDEAGGATLPPVASTPATQVMIAII